MNTPPLPAGAVCATCAEPLSADGSCLACLLRAGMEETAIEVPTLAPAMQYGDFEVARREDGSPWELGRGAMGITYKALDAVLRRAVALKVIQLRGDKGEPNAATSVALRERFLREARAAAALRHANVATVFQFGASEQANRCYYAMELVEGETLEARVRREGPLDVPTVLEIARQVSTALVAATNSGLIHRDLKPSNLMLSETKVGGHAEVAVKVIDFGLAKATAAVNEADLTHGGFVGTPAFASPEQLEGTELDGRSDIFSLGVTLWYALTGRTPFPARSHHEFSSAFSTPLALPVKQLEARKVPRPVIALLQTMLAADPTERPASASELLTKIEACQPSRGGHYRAGSASGSSLRRPGGLLITFVLASVMLLSAGGWFAFLRTGKSDPTKPGLPVPEKSVVVLPFRNLSNDQTNAYFAEGIEDEIRENLAKVADLKVISRTSAQSFGPDQARNVREIGQTLGVAYVLEGSVAREGGFLRVHTRLIDARSDAQRWAEHYDRAAADVFSIQSELAEKIVTSLRVRISHDEKSAIDARPTADLFAYDLYLRAKELFATYPQTADWRATLLQCVRLLDEATTRDGNFALAYCLSAEVHDSLHFTGLDATPARLEFQERAITAALRLQPALGEAHLAKALWLYHGQHDAEAAHRELAVARTALPNNAQLFQTSSYIYRRQGRWQEALENQARALTLDPSNYEVINGQIDLFDMLRRYADEIHTAEVGMVNVPASANYFRLMKAQALLEAGQIDAARSTLGTLPAVYDPNGAATYTRVLAALYAGTLDEAAAVLAGFHSEEYVGPGGVTTPRAWLAGLVAKSAGDEQQAIKEFTAAREKVALIVNQDAGNPFALALLGLIDANLGHKEVALREGQEIIKMRPIAVDACDGAVLSGVMALIYSKTGEPEAAMQCLHGLRDIPAGPDYGQLCYDPAWAALRGRQDFAELLTRMRPPKF